MVATAKSLTDDAIWIGPHRLSGRALMAPMAGITDPPFRRIVRRFGAAVAASEMTTADTSLWQSRKSQQRLAFDDEAGLRVVQIAGADAEPMAQAAIALEQMGADIVDINMGCPAKKVCRKLAGSALLRDETEVATILNAVVNAVTIPVTLKTRTGWDTDNRNIVRIATLAEDSGIAALAVHGRTRACRFGGTAEYAHIAAAAAAVRIPVFANGDITTPEKALEVYQASNVAGVMIGRAAKGQPWIFRDINAALDKNGSVSRLSIVEVRDIILGHLEDMYRFYGDKSGVRVARKHLIAYSENLTGGDAFRRAVVREEAATQQFEMTASFLATTSWSISTPRAGAGTE
ncbi:MAG: tRNA dihydrouridine synthase DusB [Pseudomonadota bacterium]